MEPHREKDKIMCNCAFNGRYNECCGRSDRNVNYNTDRPVKVPVMITHGTQYSQDWNLNISGPDLVTTGVPDWVVDAAGEAMHKAINEIMNEARDKIAEVMGENYNVSLDHI